MSQTPSGCISYSSSTDRTDLCGSTTGINNILYYRYFLDTQRQPHNNTTQSNNTVEAAWAYMRDTAAAQGLCCLTTVSRAADATYHHPECIVVGSVGDGKITGLPLMRPGTPQCPASSKSQVFCPGVLYPGPAISEAAVMAHQK